ncbi:DnaB-like helicase C-terminal domain-containing protein [Metamycoplasma hyosynoviae]|uniref:DnaB-like helicase C-terminal domain-containing protein n=1 Tax=Metamycoplasma hyosynoviae TaxID=29559 RepID=UPI002358B6D0|nr:DnaB-like helicase C-terminal domain-containing protein [Metamycoplasma hyosynoviae]MDC8920989.1 DnaB-like helicase C-terminal domain-containing protein [Metamycoplasma hyosynoviae]
MSSKIYELSNLFKKYEDMKEIEKTDKILFTKFKSIDKFTDGLQNRQLFILAARPGVGKTTLLQNIMNNASKQLKADEYILFLSLELSVVDVYKRFLQIESDILTKSDINDYEPNDQIKLEFEKIKTKFANKNILIFDNETNEQITPTYIQKMW